MPQQKATSEGSAITNTCIDFQTVQLPTAASGFRLSQQ